MGNLETFIHVAVAMIVVIIVARLMGNAMAYIKQPRVVGEMIAGVLLGPTLVGTLFPEWYAYLFTTTQPFIYALGNIGLSFYMFLVGMNLDLSIIEKKAKKQAYILSIIATIVPFAMGCLCAYVFYDHLSLPNISLILFMLFFGTAFSIMAFPMLARILEEKKLINSLLGSMALLSASIQDVVTWILLAFIIAIGSTGSSLNGFITLLGAIVFVFLINYLVKPLVLKMNVSIEKNASMSQNQFAIILILLLVSTVITDKIGLYSVFGGFILGLSLPKTKILQTEINTKLQDVMVVLLLPLFFAFSGLKTNFLVLCSSQLLVPCIVILFCAFISKYGAVLFSMRLFGYSWRDSSAIAGLINARGLMELIVANIGLQYNIIDSNTFSILVLIAVVTTMSAMPIYNFSLKTSNLKID
jgi:Kef-type K+ transport system membrane component KefB